MGEIFNTRPVSRVPEPFIAISTIVFLQPVIRYYRMIRLSFKAKLCELHKTNFSDVFMSQYLRTASFVLSNQNLYFCQSNYNFNTYFYYIALKVKKLC